MSKKVAIASDHGGFHLKTYLVDELSKLGYTIIDRGPENTNSVDYPDYAAIVAQDVVNKTADCGILICGTGIGISIAANKINGIRCALCHDVFSAEATRAHNNSNILAMGERVIGQGHALFIAKKWLETEFEGGRHQIRVEKVTKLEK